MAKKAMRWDSMDKDKTPLEKLVLQYEAFNRSEGKTSKTVSWYNTSLYLFLDYLRGQGIEPTLGSVDIGVVRDYVLHLQKRNKFAEHPTTPSRGELLAPTSIQCYIRAIKAFFNWLYKEGYTQENNLERLRIPKAPNKLIDPLTEVEVAAILSSIDTQTSWGARNSTIVLLLLDTGLRFSELLNLDTKDLHLEDSYVKVMGKGQKERIVPFGSSAQKALMKYMFHFRPEPLREERVFLNLDGSAMTATGLKLMIERLAKSSGVERMHAHLLRHTFAVNYLMNGGDVFTLQQILGHTTLEMVRRYVNLANAHVMTQHKRFPPVDRMNLRQVSRAVTLQKGRGRVRKAGVVAGR
jgi:site-specific recombinase XerD